MNRQYLVELSLCRWNSDGSVNGIDCCFPARWKWTKRLKKRKKIEEKSIQKRLDLKSAVVSIWSFQQLSNLFGAVSHITNCVWCVCSLILVLVSMFALHYGQEIFAKNSIFSRIFIVFDLLTKRNSAHFNVDECWHKFNLNGNHFINYGATSRIVFVSLTRKQK